METAGTVSTEPIGDVSVVVLSGEHDLNTAPDVRVALEAALAAGALIVDLSPATFVDSSILGVILDARRAAGEAQSGFAVVIEGAGHDPVRRVLEMTGLLSELPVLDSREVAIGLAEAAPTSP